MRQFIPFAIPSGASPAVQTQSKTATITTNGGTVTVQPDSGKLLTSVKVTANIPTEVKTRTITANGSYTITPTSGKLMTKATVSINVPTGSGLPSSIAAIEHGSFMSQSSAVDTVSHTFTPSIRPDLIVFYTSENVNSNYAIVSGIFQTYDSLSGVVKTKNSAGALTGVVNNIMRYSGNNLELVNVTTARWTTYLTYYYFIIQLAEIPTTAGDPPHTGTSEPGVML